MDHRYLHEMEVVEFRWEGIGHRVLPCMLFLMILLPMFSACDGPEHDPEKDFFQGQEAQKRLLEKANNEQADADELRALSSAHDFFLFDGGNFNGTIRYFKFTCDSQEDCWRALRALDAPTQEEFQPWSPSEFAVVMEGPAFYFPVLKTGWWTLRDISEGTVYEFTRDNSLLIYCAIDLERNTVFGIYESGGFPADKVNP